MRFHRVPPLLQKVFPDYIWHKPQSEKAIYLTFDDGPIPEVTEFVLSELKKFNAAATFFCVGDNLRKYPGIAQKIFAEKHRIGNHTFNHLNGWKTALTDYVENVKKCAEILAKTVPEQKGSKLFRPPYGKITRKQAVALKSEYDIIMWDVLSYDFDAGLPPEKCLLKTVQHTQPGSVIVFHDSLKARRNLEFVLPRFLRHFTDKGFIFKAI